MLRVAHGEDRVEPACCMRSTAARPGRVLVVSLQGDRLRCVLAVSRRACGRVIYKLTAVRELYVSSCYASFKRCGARADTWSRRAKRFKYCELPSTWICEIPSSEDQPCTCRGLITAICSLCLPVRVSCRALRDLVRSAKTRRPAESVAERRLCSPTLSIC